MLTATRDSDGEKVLARDSERTHAPFSCPSCLRPLSIRKGSIRTHHFAHLPPLICRRGLGESLAHLRAKMEIYDALKREPNVSALEVERDFETSIADVYAVIDGVPVAIEIQRSVLTVNDITARTRLYHRLGIAVIWVALPSSDLFEDRYSPAAWEKWLHGACFGRVYYWQGGQTLHAVHFDPYSIYVEPRTWHHEGGYQQSAGDYDRNSKRWRKPNHGKPVLLSRDFARSARMPWSGGSVEIPRCTLFLDRQPKLWDVPVTSAES